MDRLQGIRNMAGAQDTHIGGRIFFFGNRQMDDHFPAGPEVTFFDFKPCLYVDVILQDSLFLKLAYGFTPKFGVRADSAARAGLERAAISGCVAVSVSKKRWKYLFSPLRKIKSILPAVSSVRNSSSVKEGIVSLISASAWG